MTDKYHAQMTKIRSARIELLGKHPFFGDLAFGLPIEWNESLNPPTAATDGKRIIFHPKFVEDLPVKQLVFVIAHEVMHPALLHILRIGKRCPKKWNVACDIVVNQLLRQSNVGEQPSWVIYDPNMYMQGQGNVEKIYDLLPAGDYGEPGSGPGGGKGSMDAIIEATSGEEQDAAANWRNKLHQALQTAKRAGNAPGDLEAFVEQMTKPQVSWEQHLRNFVMTTRGKERTWTKRNRRYASLDLALPGNHGEEMGELAFLIDCSGSTSDRMIGQCAAELASIQEELRPEKLHVLYFDTKVHKHDEFDPDTPITVKAHGRGGTCFRSAFEYMRQKGIEPEACVVATDLGCWDFGPQPSFPVLWCVMESTLNHAPWGQTLIVK
jgi:predicted metal-dependent peptidase